MLNVIEALSRKKASLNSRKMAIQQEAASEIAMVDEQISDVDKAICVIREAVKDVLCPVCHGNGTVRKCDAAGDVDDDVCDACKGTGIKI